MTAIDPFGKTDELDEATLEALAARFEARGRHPLFSDCHYYGYVARRRPQASRRRA
jgi:hypothetical protein